MLYQTQLLSFIIKAEFDITEIVKEQLINFLTIMELDDLVLIYSDNLSISHTQGHATQAMYSLNGKIDFTNLISFK